jgi:hypothetical protein
LVHFLSIVIQNAQKVSYSNEEFKKFSGETPPGPPLYRRGDVLGGGRGVAVARFLIIKNHRASVPDAELYRDREFVKKFFAVDAII